MARAIVIADDLTGAADAGVMFCPCFRPVFLVAGFRFDYPSTVRDEAAVLSLDTGTRPLTPAAARSRLQILLPGVQEQHPEWIFKKIDSSLRGNIGAEADTIVEETDNACTFISAAFPALGRTTIQGIHRIHGLPVADTELRHDPSTPVTESRIAAVVAAQSRYPVGHVGLEVLQGGPDALQDEVEALRVKGCVHLTFDCTRDEHLEAIVALAADRTEKVLLVGTAGLARAAARHWGEKTEKEIPDDLPDSGGHPLYVCGTVAERSAEQIASLCDSTSCSVIDLDPGLLADSHSRPELIRMARELRTTLAQQAMVLRVAPEESDKGSGKRRWSAAQVAQGLGLAVAELVRNTRPKALFCSGGDTASSVMETLGSWGSELRREIVPGMVLGILRGGGLDGVPFITKPGSFGEKEDMVELHRTLTTEKKGNRL